MALSEPLKSKAFEELREDDTRKVQALEQFRAWISKQGHIKNCRTDDSFLLRFLRVKKYSNADAFKMLEKFLISSESHPKWFRHLTLDDERMMELFESGYIFPLKDRDENGCRIIMIQAGKLDTKKFTFSDVLKIINLVIFTLLEEPETQVAGFRYILDHKNIALDYVGLFSLTDMRNYLKCITNAIPCRQKQAIWVHLPTFAVKLTDLAKIIVSSKLRERAHFYKDFDNVYGHITSNILPQEFGGQIPLKEMMENFKNIAEGFRSQLNQLDDQHIDLSSIKNHDKDAIDSFRKLEID